MTLVPWKKRPRDPATSGRLPRMPLHTTAVASDGPLSLERYDDGVECVSGVQLSQLEPNTLLDLQTAGCRYRVVVCDPTRGEVLIQGGRCFPRYTAVRLSGAGLEVNPMKTGWIGLGLAARGESPASHRDGRCARLARRDEGANREFSTEEQRSPGGMQRPSNAVGLSPRTARHRDRVGRPQDHHRAGSRYLPRSPTRQQSGRPDRRLSHRFAPQLSPASCLLRHTSVASPRSEMPHEGQPDGWCAVVPRGRRPRSGGRTHPAS